MITADPVSPAPNNPRGSNMKLAPRNAAAAPAAADTEFIRTTSARGTTCGRAADRPEPTNRVKPLAISAPHSTGISGAPDANNAATTATSSSRPAFAVTSTQRRSQRSSSAPANGPSSEYGRNSTANAPAMAHGVAARSGLNSSAPASPA